MKLLASNQIEKDAGWGAEWFLDVGFRDSGVAVVNVDYKIHQFSLCKTFSELSDEEYDGFFLQRGDFFPHDVLSALPQPRIFWATELVSRRVDQHINLQSDLFDFVFVRSIPCRETVLEKGWKQPEQVSVMSSGFSTDLFHLIPLIPRDIDVVFVGSPMPRRDRILEEIRREIPILVTRAYGTELNELYNRSKIVLNLHSSDYPDTETRVYEALGSGAFLLSEPLSNENPFRNNVDYIEVKSVQDLIKKIRYYLLHEEERQTIAQHGHDSAQDHTYHARARKIIKEFERLQKGEIRKRIDKQILNRIAWKEPFRAARWYSNRLVYRAHRKSCRLLGLR